MGITSNPSYVATLMKTEPDFVDATVEKVVSQASADADEEELAMQVIRETVSRPLAMFHPQFKETDGRHGYVAIQGSPRRNHDLSGILEEADGFRELGENIIIKVPSTVEGAQAMEDMTARGWSTIGTMSFSVSQYIYMAEAHRRGLQRTDKKPSCLITMLPGMFEEYLAEDADRRGVEVSPEVISHAGIHTAREAHKIYRERNYEAIIISGTAQRTDHWTELVGQGMAVTLSGKLGGDLIDEHPPVVERIGASAPQKIIDELRDKFPDFVRACDMDAIDPSEFRPYGPVVRFHSSLSDGFTTIVEKIQGVRAVR